MDKPSIHSEDHLPMGSDPIRDLRLFYVEPVAPALEPGDFRAGDALNSVWAGAWANVDDVHPATGYSLVTGGKPYMQIAATGDESSTNSLMFVLPEAFWPTVIRTLVIVCGADAQSLGVVNVYPDGDITFDGGSVVFVRQIA